MESAHQEPPKPVKAARILNQRIIKISYLRSTVYFLIAVAVFLLFYFLVFNLPHTQ